MNKLIKTSLIATILTGGAMAAAMEVTLPDVGAGSTLILNKSIALKTTLTNYGTIKSEVGGVNVSAVSNSGAKLVNVVAADVVTIGDEHHIQYTEAIIDGSVTVTNGVLETTEAVLKVDKDNKGYVYATPLYLSNTLSSGVKLEKLVLEPNDGNEITFAYSLYDENLSLGDGEKFDIVIRGPLTFNTDLSNLEKSNLVFENASGTTATLNASETSCTQNITSDAKTTLNFRNCTYSGTATLNGVANLENVNMQSADCIVNINSNCSFTDCTLSGGATLRIGILE